VSIWSPAFATSLREWAVDLGLREQRFVARNFLFDERPSPTRVAGYEALGTDALEDDDEWYQLHERYLDERIRPRPAAGLRPLLRLTEAPETFVVDPQFSSFAGAAHALHLVRVVKVANLAWLARRPLEEVLAAIEDARELDLVLDDVNERLDGRPTFAGFYEDVAHLLPEDEGDAWGDWADQLRNVFGLWDMSPPPGVELPILVFRYAVGEVVRLAGLGTRRPLAVPSVVDIDQFAAFCPAPAGVDVGQIVDLGGDRHRPPAGELLHPSMRLRAADVFRLGHVRTPAPDLSKARAVHLQLMRSRTGSAFGAGFDDDVLSL
jgi:hypothetical protein